MKNVAHFKDLIGRAMQLYQQHHEKYVSLIPDYESLLEQKRALGITLNVIKRSDLKEYPDIEFLKFESEKSAFHFLLAQTPRKISQIIGEIDTMTNVNYAYRTLSDWVIEAKWLVEWDGKAKPYGIRTDYPITGAGRISNRFIK